MGSTLKLRGSNCSSIRFLEASLPPHSPLPMFQWWFGKKCNLICTPHNLTPSLYCVSGDMKFKIFCPPPLSDVLGPRLSFPPKFLDRNLCTVMKKLMRVKLCLQQYTHIYFLVEISILIKYIVFLPSIFNYGSSDEAHEDLLLFHLHKNLNGIRELSRNYKFLNETNLFKSSTLKELQVLIKLYCCFKMSLFEKCSISLY